MQPCPAIDSHFILVERAGFVLPFLLHSSLIVTFRILQALSLPGCCHRVSITCCVLVTVVCLRDLSLLPTQYNILRHVTVQSDACLRLMLPAENLEVPGPSFAGDREDVVEKWLKRNQQILAGLDI